MALQRVVLEEGEVEQVVVDQRSVRLFKQVIRVDAEVPVFLVRKHRVGGPARPPVLLVHGFAQNRYSWHNSRRSMSAWLAERGWDTWNLELRGHGRSRSAGADGAERFPDYVEDVRIASQAIGAPAFWIGHSLGGAALYAAAAELSERDREGRTGPGIRPRGVVGVGALYAFGGANRLLGGLGRLTHSFRDAEWMPRLQVRTRMAGFLLSRLYGISDVAGYAFPVSGWWPGSIEPEVLQERLERGFDWTSVRVWQEMARWAATGSFPWDEAWSRTDVPLLVLAGDEDHLMPPKDAAAAYERSGSHDKRLLVFDDWHHQTHWGHLDLVLGRLAPVHVWPAIDDWMRERSTEDGPSVPVGGTVRP